MSDRRYFNETELADRWRLSVRTLQRWRWQRKGPPFVKFLGGRVVYWLDDVEAFEAAQRNLPAQARRAGS